MNQIGRTGQEGKRRWQIFLLVASGVFLSTMDSSMVNVALPTIMRAFSAQLIDVQWVVLIYLLTITVSLLFWGIAADRLGKNIIYILGIGVFCAGSLACAFAPSLGFLIGFRFVEGMGAAMMMAAGPAIIRDAFPRNQLGKGLGFVGIATSLGLMSGPVVSGLLISGYSWRTIFLATVPLSLVVMIGGSYVLSRPGMLTPPRKDRLLDWKGAALWVTVVSSFILYAHYLPSISLGWKIAGAVWLVLVVWLFSYAEKTRKSEILPLHLFGKSYYHIGLITAAASFGALFVVLILMPFFLDYVKNLPTNVIGLVMMSVPLTLFIVSPSAGMLYDRLGSRYLTTAGLAICFCSLLLLAFLDENSSLASISGRLALLGMGQSMFLAPNTASLLTRIHDSDAGITSGLLATSRNLGMLTGAAFAGIVFAAWFSFMSGGAELKNYLPEQVDIFVLSFRATLLCTAVISLLAAVISWQRER